MSSSTTKDEEKPFICNKCGDGKFTVNLSPRNGSKTTNNIILSCINCKSEYITISNWKFTQVFPRKIN